MIFSYYGLFFAFWGPAVPGGKLSAAAVPGKKGPGKVSDLGRKTPEAAVPVCFTQGITRCTNNTYLTCVKILSFQIITH